MCRAARGAKDDAVKGSIPHVLCSKIAKVCLTYRSIWKMRLGRRRGRGLNTQMKSVSGVNPVSTNESKAR